MDSFWPHPVSRFSICIQPWASSILQTRQQFALCAFMLEKGTQMQKSKTQQLGNALLFLLMSVSTITMKGEE